MKLVSSCDCFYLKLIRQYLLLLCLLLSSCLSYSQRSGYDSSKTMLWKIEGNGLNTSSYMYGTLHVVCEKSIKLSDTIKNALLHCEDFFLEHGRRSFKEDSLLNANFMMGKSLKELIGNYYYRKIKSAFKNRIYIGEDSLNLMTPFMVEKLFVVASYNCKTKSYDRCLEEIALNSSKQVQFLESSKEEDSAIYRMPLADQVAHLGSVIDHINNVIAADNLFQEIYDEKDLVQLYNRTFNTGRIGEESIRNIILDTRNINWLPVMQNAMKQHSCFFAFGCAHLVGANGMISLLLQKGYKVTPVFY